VSCKDFFKSCVQHLEEGGMLLYPTETVWGLGVRADSSKAIADLNQFKKRKSQQAQSLLLPHRHMATHYAYIPEKVDDLISIFWPGDVSFVLPARDNILPEVHGGTHFVGLRCSSHPFVSELMGQCSFAVTTTSANISGQKTGCELADFDEWPAFILKPRPQVLEAFSFEAHKYPSLVVKFNLNSRIYEVLRSTPRLKSFELIASDFGFIKSSS